MADDKLKIVATVEDQFTGPLSKLQKGLKSVGDETAKQGAAWKKDWEGVRGEVSKFQGVLRGFDPILSAVGVGSLGAAMSIAGMVAAVKNFSGQTRDLSQMGRQIGMTVDQLRTLGSLGEKFGVSADAMRSAIGQFATNMVDLRQRWGQVYGELKNMNLGHLAEELVNAPSMEAAVETAMKALQNIPDSMKAARVSTLIFGTPDMATISRSITGKISDALKQTQADIGHLDKETEESARRFEEHFSRIGRAAEKLKLKVLGPALKGIVDIIDDADKNGLSGNEDQQALRNQLSPFGGPAATPREKLEGRRAQVQSQLDLLERGPHGADYERKHARMVEELKRVADELQKLREQGSSASISPSGYSDPASGGGSLIQKAAWGGFGSAGYGAAIPAYGSPGGIGGGGGSGAAGGADLGDGIRGRPFGSRGSLGGSRGAVGEVPVGDRGLLDLIAHAEGTTRRGYNDSFAHQLGGDLTGKTLAEIEQIQRRMRGSSAIGRYQFMRGTLFGNGRGDHGLVGELGIGRGERFTPELQDRLGNALIERRYREAQRNQRRYGGDFMRHFRTALAREWASFPGDYGQRGRNGGMYPGQSASIGRDRLTQGAQRWLDEREGRTARSGPRAPASSAGDGIRQTQPWTRAPAIPPTGNRADNVSLRSRDRNERASIDDFLMENEAQTRQQRQGETFQDFYRRRATTADGYTGHSWGQREDEVQRRPRDGSGDSMFGSARTMTDELNGTHRDNATRRGPDGLTYEEYLDRGVQDRKPRESEFTPQRELSLDEIRRFRGPNRGVGDALMNRFYGSGAPGGGSSAQMPGGAGPGGRGTLHIKVDGPPGTQVKPDMSDLFKDTTVSRGRSQMDL
ncbi:hypothetical protein ACLBX9_27800 [Methylobacterium sp. A49B]